MWVILHSKKGKFVSAKRLYKGGKTKKPRLVRDIRKAAKWDSWVEVGRFSGLIALENGTFSSPKGPYEIIEIRKV